MRTGLPIVSLYGNNKKPTNEQLKNILEGLSYSARFFFEIEDKKVTIRFQTL